MFDTIRKRFMTAFMAASVAIGALACPVNVMADEDDDLLEDLMNRTPEELDFLDSIIDEDSDGDIDESDIKAAVAALEVADALAEAAEYQQKIEDEMRRKELEDAQRLAALEAKKRAELEAQLKAERDRRVTGIAVSTTYVTLHPGQTYQVFAYVKPDNARNKRYYFNSNNPSVASIDGSGIIRANGAGNAVICATTDENGYRAYITVDVNYAPVVAAQTVAQDANWTTIAASMIIAAVPGATVNLVAPKALSFDAGMINALKARPDVSLLIAYPYNGHTYTLAVPAGYNLAAKMDKTGKVSFVKLAAVSDGKLVTKMVM